MGSVITKPDFTKPMPLRDWPIFNISGIEPADATDDREIETIRIMDHIVPVGRAIDAIQRGHALFQVFAEHGPTPVIVNHDSKTGTEFLTTAQTGLFDREICVFLNPSFMASQ